MRQKDFPRRVWVKGRGKAAIFYDVKFVRRIPGEPKPESVWAACECVSRIIYMSQGIPANRRYGIFLHEYVHAIEFEYGIRVRHGWIDLIDRPLGEGEERFWREVYDGKAKQARTHGVRSSKGKAGKRTGY